MGSITSNREESLNIFYWQQIAPIMDMEYVQSATLKNAAEHNIHRPSPPIPPLSRTTIACHARIVLTSSSPLATFSDRWMNCLLHKSLHTAMASGRDLNLGNSFGHLVPFFGSTKKLTSFSPIIYNELCVIIICKWRKVSLSISMKS